jgi:cytochrome c biogenesis protein CcdA
MRRALHGATETDWLRDDVKWRTIMRILLFILGLVAFLYGASVMGVARSAVHEIEAFILFLIGAVFISGAAIVEAVNAVRKKLEMPLHPNK